MSQRAERSGNPFEVLELSSALALVPLELGYEAPTEIQKLSIPLLLKGKDLIGQSQTGSGKTAAFTLPILERLNLKPRALQALILCPTRELCAQVAREVRKLGRRHPGLQVLVLAGGAPMGPQLGALEQGVHLVVGTPGRVLDHLKRGSLNCAQIRTVVLDEADRMLEMGFQLDMERILSQTPKNRQTVLFSATFPPTIETLSLKYQRSPERVTVASAAQPVAAIRHVIYEVAPQEKLKVLLWALHQNEPESAIIFCNLKTTVDEVARQLQSAGVSVAALHGDLEQVARDRVMAKFRNQSVRMLVATDVAARGLDVEGVDVVFNYDLPAQPEIYVHRIGRTGRAGRKGRAISLYSPRENPKIQSIERLTGISLQKKSASIQESPLPLKAQAAMQTLHLSAGRKEKMRPGDILGALTGEAGGLKGTQVGKIEIHDHFSYVAVSTDVFSLALERLRLGKIKGRSIRVSAIR